jgi:hypothetical protein
MKPSKFHGSNITFAENQPEYLPLPAYRTSDGTVTTAWKMSLWERVKVLFTGTIYLQMLTFNHPLQPVLLTTTNPISVAAKPQEVPLPSLE